MLPAQGELLVRLWEGDWDGVLEIAGSLPDDHPTRILAEACAANDREQLARLADEAKAVAIEAGHPRVGSSSARQK